LIADLGEGVVGSGHPMVPASERQRARSVGTMDIRCGDCRDGTKSRGLENSTTRKARTSHCDLPGLAAFFFGFPERILPPQAARLAINGGFAAAAHAIAPLGSAISDRVARNRMKRIGCTGADPGSSTGWRPSASQCTCHL